MFKFLNALRLNCYSEVINRICYISGSLLPEILENTLLHICTGRIKLLCSCCSTVYFVSEAIKPSVQRISVEHTYILHGSFSCGISTDTSYR